MNEEQFKQLLNVLTGIKEEIGEVAFNLTELRGQFEVTNRLHTDTTGNMLSELVWATLNNKADKDIQASQFDGKNPDEIYKN